MCLMLEGFTNSPELNPLPTSQDLLSTFGTDLSEVAPNTHARTSYLTPP